MVLGMPGSSSSGPPRRCEAAQQLAGDKIAELDAKIASLTAMKDSLRSLLDTCSRPRRHRECPLIQSIETDAVGAGT